MNRPSCAPAQLSANLAAAIVLAVVFRLGFASQTVMYHADEVWQYTEPAYGLVTGRWFQTWEFIDSIRGWFVPMLLVPPMALGHWLSPASDLNLVLPRVFLAILSLGIPWAFHDLARPLGRRSAVVAVWVGAIWPELFFFASRSSGEGLAMSLLFPAAALAERTRRGAGLGTAALTGLLLALGCVVRFQYAPAVAVLAVWAIWRAAPRTVLALMAGALAGLIIGGAADALAGQVPYAWLWRNVAANIHQGRSEFFGTEPPYWLIGAMLENWWWASLAIVPLAAVGAWRLPVILAVAVAVIAVHSAVAHKEYRFILLGANALVLLAAVGSVEVSAPIASRLGLSAGVETGVLQAFWLGLALWMALGPVFVENWGSGTIRLVTLQQAGAAAGTCGVASYRMRYHPALSHAYLNRPVQTLMFDGPWAARQAEDNKARFSAAIATRTEGATLPREFHLHACYRQMDRPLAAQYMCVFVRAGACQPGAGDFDYQTAMRRRGR